MTTSTRSHTFGGNGGMSFDDSHDIALWGPIRQVVVRHGSAVDAIGVLWGNGNFFNHGGTGGTETVINLGADEFISRVEGRSGARLDQITFHSNKHTYGPYGGGGGNPFAIDFSGKALHYLFGRVGTRVDQVGFAYGDKPEALPTTIARSREHGGDGGSAFDDLSAAGNLLGKITSITVRHGTYVDGIAVSYDGQPGSNTHGGYGGTEDTFDLGPHEWVTEVHGRSATYLDQVQFYLSSGRVSPAYGGNGGDAFVERRRNSVVKAFFGRSASLVDQLGFYFEDAKPLSVVLTSVNYDLSHLNVLALAPESVLTVILNNDTSEKQTVTQMETVQTSDSSTTTIAETSEMSVSFTTKVDFIVTGASITTGYKQGNTYSTGSMHTDQKSYSVTFSAVVPANNSVVAHCLVRKGTYDVPWTATAEVTYWDRPQPTTMTLHGTLQGIATTSVEAQYEPAQPSTP